MKRISKGKALLIGLFLISLFGGLSFIFPERTGHLAVLLTTLASLTTAYIGLQVADSCAKGKFFNAEYYTATNTTEERNDRAK
jgi:hypothetical protein